MRHNVVNNKFRMKTSHRIATFRNMTISLIDHCKIETTLDKAKVLRGVIEPLITIAKNGISEDGKCDLAARRLLLKKLPNVSSVARLIDVVAPAFKDRKGGYTRVLKLGRRQGDNAEMAIIEFVEENIAPALQGREAKKALKEKRAQKRAERAEKANKAAGVQNKQTAENNQ